MKKSIVLFFIFISSLFLITGCEDKQKNTKLTVAEVTHSIFYAPWYVALEKGYFKDENLDIEVILTPGADKVGSAVLSGDAQIGLSGLEATMYVYNNESKDYLISFSALTKRDGQFLIGPCEEKSNFTIENLKNKRILVGRKGGMPAMVFNYGLYKNGLTDKDVVLDYSVDFASLSGAFIGKQGDYVNLFEPIASSIEKEGYGCILKSVGILGGELPYTVFHTKKSFIKNNKSTLKKFVHAIERGLKYVKENDSKVIAKDIINQFPDTKIKDLEEIIERYKEADSWWDNAFISKYAYDNLVELMKYNNALNEEVDYNILVDNSINGHRSSN